jgi:hypothetical protein
MQDILKMTQVCFYFIEFFYIEILFVEVVVKTHMALWTKAKKVFLRAGKAHKQIQRFAAEHIIDSDTVKLSRFYIFIKGFISFSRNQLLMKVWILLKMLISKN